MKRTFALVSLVAILVAGCEKPGADDQKTNDNQTTNHSGWWCAEHGIPEEECSMCSTKAAEKFEKDDDWCKKHDRADSQCFICHPERKEFYAAKYRAKFGKEPPKPVE